MYIKYLLTFHMFQHGHIKKASVLHFPFVYNVHLDILFSIFLTHIHFYITHYLRACNCYLFIFDISCVHKHVFVLMFPTVNSKSITVLIKKQSERTKFIYHLKHLKLTNTFNWDGFIFMHFFFLISVLYFCIHNKPGITAK